MLSSVSQLSEFTPELLEKSLADGAFVAAAQQAQVLAFTNWTLYPHMTACWHYLQEHVLSKLTHRPWLFIDLVDPRSRSDADISAMLDILPGFETNCRTIFGGNLNESNAVARLLGVEQIEDEDGEVVAAQAVALREKLGISQVATHCIGSAAYADATGSWHATGPYCAKPLKSTGAGDRYNAGYCPRHRARPTASSWAAPARQRHLWLFRAPCPQRQPR